MNEREMLDEYMRVRLEVDADMILDGYDFTLGWLLGKGVSADVADAWIEYWASQGHITWPSREDVKTAVANAVRKEKFVQDVLVEVIGDLVPTAKR